MGKVVPFPKECMTQATREELKRNLVNMGLYADKIYVPDILVDYIFYSFQMCYEAGVKKGREEP
jgi:hypothetical protein